MGPHPKPDEAELTATSSWGSGRTAAIFDRYAPPFELTTDMLFALALCPTAPLRRTFPGVPFLSLLGKTPLVIWFSRVTEACYRDATGQRRCDRHTEGVPYNELNVLALLRARALFVPGIYATSELSVSIGHGYGMPKQLTAMTVTTTANRFSATTAGLASPSFVQARLLGSGRAVAKLLSPLWPRRVWPVRFPSGSEVRGTIQAAPRIQLAHVQRGPLSVEATWLAEPVSLLPVGVLTPALRMELPPP